MVGEHFIRLVTGSTLFWEFSRPLHGRKWFLPQHGRKRCSMGKEEGQEQQFCKIPTFTEMLGTSLFLFLCSYTPVILLFPHCKSKDSPIGMENYCLVILKQRNPSSPKCKKCKSSTLRILVRERDCIFFSPFPATGHETSARIRKTWHYSFPLPTVWVLIHPTSIQSKITTQSYLP